MTLAALLTALALAKEGRDPYGVPQEALSENFALRWGSGLSQEQAQATLAVLETTWAALVQDEGYPAPAGSEQALFNVYVGSSGGGSPSSLGADAYYSLDSEGQPMVVLSVSVAQDAETWGGVAAHELVHALQDAAGRPYDRADTRWWWEAHAMWCERLLFPEKDAWARFSWVMPFAPELALTADGDGSFTPEGLHPWGAGLFPVWLSESQGLTQALHDTWRSPGEDPMDEFEAQAGPLPPLWLGFGLDLAAWDIGDPALLEQAYEDAQRLLPGQDRRRADEQRGSMDWTPCPAETQPAPLAFNLLSLREPEGGEHLEIGFEAESPEAWSLGLLLWRDGLAQRLTLDEAWRDGTLRIEGAGDVERAELLLAFSPQGEASAACSWWMGAVPAELEGSEPSTPEGCRGCAGVLALLGLHGWRRGRSTPPGNPPRSRRWSRPPR